MFTEYRIDREINSNEINGVSSWKIVYADDRAELDRKYRRAVSEVRKGKTGGMVSVSGYYRDGSVASLMNTTISSAF